MGTEQRAPRRFKLPSELEEGESGRVERDAYVAWRKRMLEDDEAELDLRERLLRESAEQLRARAGRRKMRKLESLSIEDHMSRMEQEREAGHEGDDPPPVDERAARLEARAAEMEAAADEIAQALLEQPSVEDRIKEIEERPR